MYKKLYITLCSVLCFFLLTQPVSAHVSVKPEEADVATMQTFTVSVPTEKNFSTIQVRLLIPDSVNYVTPQVKPGWNIDVKKIGEDEETKITEITWSGGDIPTGLKDEFSFSAQVPAKATILQWKAYQTYADGEEIAWDANPSSMSTTKEDSEGDEDHETTHPYAETKIVNDLIQTPPEKKATEGVTPTQALSIAYIALALAAVSLGMQLRSPYQNSQNKTRKT